MSFTLFKMTLKNNFFILAIFCAVMSLYISIMTYMFDPSTSDSLMEMMEMMPSEMIAAMGFDSASSDLTGFLAGFYYGFLVYLFPMVYCIIMGNRLVANMVDNGSFAYLLQTPTSRVQIIVTQAIYFIFSITVLFCVVFSVGVFMSNTMYPDMLNLKLYSKMHFTAMLLTICIGMICFFYSCLFNESKNSLSLGAGLPIAFLLLYLIGGSSSDAEIYMNMSIYSLYDATEIIRTGEVLWTNILFISISTILLISSVIIFNKKRLPL